MHRSGVAGKFIELGEAALPVALLNGALVRTFEGGTEDEVRVVVIETKGAQFVDASKGRLVSTDGFAVSANFPDENSATTVATNHRVAVRQSSRFFDRAGQTVNLDGEHIATLRSEIEFGKPVVPRDEQAVVADELEVTPATSCAPVLRRVVEIDVVNLRVPLVLQKQLAR